MFNEGCALCQKPVSNTNPELWYEIVGWVHGAKKDSLCLRELSGLVAHGECIKKAKAGVAPDQESLFD